MDSNNNKIPAPIPSQCTPYSQDCLSPEEFRTSPTGRNSRNPTHTMLGWLEGHPTSPDHAGHAGRSPNWSTPCWAGWKVTQLVHTIQGGRKGHPTGPHHAGQARSSPNQSRPWSGQKVTQTIQTVLGRLRCPHLCCA